MCLLRYTNFQRQGAVANMTAGEVMAAQKSNNDHMTVFVCNHKTTSTHGSAPIVMEIRVYQLLMRYNEPELSYVLVHIIPYHRIGAIYPQVLGYKNWCRLCVHNMHRRKSDTICHRIGEAGGTLWKKVCHHPNDDSKADCHSSFPSWHRGLCEVNF